MPSQPHTIGEHLKARRLALHRFQSDVAKELGIEKTSLQNWERGIYEPIPEFYPAIIKFLGYVPFSDDGSVGGRMRWLRLCSGWNQKEFAAASRCSVTTIWRWEDNRTFEKVRWSRGLLTLRKRLTNLGLSEPTMHVVQRLLSY